MNQTNPNTGAAHVEAALPFELISPSGGEIKVMMVCEPSQGGGAAVGMSPMAARDFWDTHVKAAHWFDPDKECLVVLCLDAKKRVKAWNLVSLGTLEASLSHPREVFRPAIVAAANGIILMHNHPSGDPTPSLADHAVTEQLGRASRIVEIPLDDHVIVGDTSNNRYRFGYFSFREHLWDTIRDLKPVSLEKSPAMARAARTRVPTEGRAQGQKTKGGVKRRAGGVNTLDLREHASFSGTVSSAESEPILRLESALDTLLRPPSPAPADPQTAAPTAGLSARPQTGPAPSR